MPTTKQHEALVDAAIDAIRAVNLDRTVSQEQTIISLNTINDELQDMLNAIGSDDDEDLNEDDDEGPGYKREWDEDGEIGSIY